MQLNYNGERAKWLTIAFYVLLGATILTLISNFLEVQLLSGGDFTDAAADANDIRQGVVIILQLIVNIVVMVLFIMWFRRAYNNLHLAGRYMEFSEGWAAGAWFVPFLNLVRPYQIMREIWVDTQEAANIEPRTQPDLVGWWWAILLISNLITNITARMYNGATTVEALETASTATMFSDAVNIVSIVIAVQLVQKVAIFEKALYEAEHEVPIEDHLIK